MFKSISLVNFLFCFLFSVAQYPGYILLNHPETFKKIIRSGDSDNGIHSI